MDIANNWRQFFTRETFSVFSAYFYKRIKQEQVPVVAGYLSYVTLMSLVPLMMVVLSVMTAFPMFSEIANSLEAFVYKNFVPTAGEVVHQYISSFVDNASKMSAIAVASLIVFALLLISAIDKSLNNIWRVDQHRRFITSFSMYWMVLTLGPILMGTSIALSSYILNLMSLGEYDTFGFGDFLFRLLPLVMTLFLFTVLYMVVPNTRVPFKFAIIGAFVAAVLFEFAKKGFAMYVTNVPSYQAIYGALATIPILFVWVYLSWFVVLLGAVTTVTIQNFDQIMKSKGKAQ